MEVVRGMLDSGGFPVVVAEERLLAARDLARETTGISVDASGASGLAGCIELAELGLLSETSSVGLLFTGIERHSREAP